MRLISNDNQLISEQIQLACEKLEICDPVEFTVRLMSGHDPRHRSKIKRFIEKIAKMRGSNLPTKSQWNEIQKLVDKEYCYRPVPLSYSTAAATQLLSYQHAKKKSIETKDTTPQVSVDNRPLTKREIADVKKLFDVHF